MDVELIPVIEIPCYNNELVSPQGNYRNNAGEWQLYKQECQKIAGFTDIITAYPLGSDFYRVRDLPDATIKKLVLSILVEKDDGLPLEEMVRLFSGGLILKINGEARIFPECCCDLLSVHDWEQLANGDKTSFWIGHPEPEVAVEGDAITFITYLSETPVVVNRLHLKKALKQAQAELQAFAQRLVALKQAEGWGINNIDNLLVG